MQQLRFDREEIVWQEVPGEVSLAFLCSGCPLRCQGCHSSGRWNAGRGAVLSEDYLRSRLQQYRGLISCVLFMGGEWHCALLEGMLRIAREEGLHTCLYTGLERSELSASLLPHLTYLKTGRWLPEQRNANDTSPGTSCHTISSRSNLSCCITLS